MNNDSYDENKIFFIIWNTQAFPNYIEEIKQMIENGLDVNFRGPHNKTPLHYAAQAKKSDIIKLLINLKADVNAQDDRNMTPLLYLINSLDEDGINALINAGADVNLSDEGELTPLMSLCIPYDQEGNIDKIINVIKTLIISGATIDLENYKGFNALQIAQDGCDNGYQSSCKIVEFLEHIVIEEQKPFDAMEIINAVKNNNIEEVKRLVVAGTHDIDYINTEDLRSALIEASARGRIEIAQILIDSDANLNLQDEFNRTALMYASDRNNTNLVTALLDTLNRDSNKVDLNLIDVNDDTALDLAESNEIKEMLIAAGAK